MGSDSWGFKSVFVLYLEEVVEGVVIIFFKRMFVRGRLVGLDGIR